MVSLWNNDGSHETVRPEYNKNNDQQKKVYRSHSIEKILHVLLHQYLLKVHCFNLQCKTRI